MSDKKCLYCYKELPENKPGDFHEQCSLDFFGTKQQPVFEHSLAQMTELAKNVVERSILLLGLNAKQINGIANRFQKRKPVALQWIDRSFLSDEYKEKYKDLLEGRYQRIEG